MSWIKEVTVFGIAEINYPAFFRESLRICDFYAVIAEAQLHSADAVESHEALVERFGLIVPFLAGVGIVGKICREAVGHLGSTFRVAGNGLVADMGMGNSVIFNYLK